uniref:Uncharacterized protein n=1 Tax=Arundo donax TaxID=35708 RepID=A0A0A9F2T6_ARUDO
MLLSPLKRHIVFFCKATILKCQIFCGLFHIFSPLRFSRMYNAKTTYNIIDLLSNVYNSSDVKSCCRLRKIMAWKPAAFDYV